MQAMQNSPGVEEAQEGSVNKVQAAEAEVAELQRRVECERQAFAQVSTNLIASTSHFDLKVRLHMPTYPTKVFKAVQTRRVAKNVSARGVDLPLLRTPAIAACRSRHSIHVKAACGCTAVITGHQIRMGDRCMHQDLPDSRHLPCSTPSGKALSACMAF